MAKTKGESSELGSSDRGVDPSLAIIAGAIAATVSRDGVMAGAHDDMVALQAIRVYSAIQRVQTMVEDDPELVFEPITEVALGRMNDGLRAKRVKARQDLLDAVAAEQAKAEATSKELAKSGG